MPWRRIEGSDRYIWEKPSEAIEAVTQAWGEKIRRERPAFSLEDPRPKDAQLIAEAALKRNINLQPIEGQVVDKDDKK